MALFIRLPVAQPFLFEYIPPHLYREFKNFIPLLQPLGYKFTHTFGLPELFYKTICKCILIFNTNRNNKTHFN